MHPDWTPLGHMLACEPMPGHEMDSADPVSQSGPSTGPRGGVSFPQSAAQRRPGVYRRSCREPERMEGLVADWRCLLSEAGVGADSLSGLGSLPRRLRCAALVCRAQSFPVDSTFLKRFPAPGSTVPRACRSLPHLTTVWRRKPGEPQCPAQSCGPELRSEGCTWSSSVPCLERLRHAVC